MSDQEDNQIEDLDDTTLPIVPATNADEFDTDSDSARMSLNQHDSPHQHRLLELRAFNVQISHFLFSNDSYVGILLTWMQFF